MHAPRNIVITHSDQSPVDQRAVEICEHKGIGHPDSITDGACEAAGRALCRAYLESTGSIRHHNLDKGLLVAGRTAVRFGGGVWLHPIRLIVCGRAAPLPDGRDVGAVAAGAARDYLRTHIRCAREHIEIETGIRAGSSDLQAIFKPGSAPLSNDTSFGVGYAPLSPLEQTVLSLAARMRSEDFRGRFPAAGDDYKIMGLRTGGRLHFTIALALIARHVADAPSYFEAKRAILEELAAVAGPDAELRLNTLDDPDARDESGLYLTVSGLSAEMGDDGQVGRGNRINGLITPCRPMSLEACAGKNPVAHAGRLYNVLAMRIAEEIHRQLPEIPEVNVRLLSAIGRPVDRPQLAQVELVGVAALTPSQRERSEAIAEMEFSRIDQLIDPMLAERIAMISDQAPRKINPNPDPSHSQENSSCQCSNSTPHSSSKWPPLPQASSRSTGQPANRPPVCAASPVTCSSPRAR